MGIPSGCAMRTQAEIDAAETVSRTIAALDTTSFWTETESNAMNMSTPPSTWLN